MGKRQLTKILVVEDEGIVAMHLKNRLKSLGYAVSAVVFSGEEAIKKAAETHPDLVLMDIWLNGEMDGIEAAEQIRVRFNIPVVYLTAYTDDETLHRAKVTEPFGYIVKPFEERELQSNIEIALYRHKMEMRLKDREQWLAVILKSIGDAVIATDARGLVTFMNSVAVALTGWKQGDVLGKDLKAVFNIINKERNNVTESPVMKTIREGVVVDLSNHILLLTRNGAERAIEGSIAPLRDDKGDITGAVLVFRDITQRKLLEEQFLHAQKMEALGTLAGGIAHDFNNILASITGYTQLNLAEVSKGTELYENLEHTLQAGYRARDLIKQIVTFSRMEEEDRRSLRIGPVIRESVKLLNASLPSTIEIRLYIKLEKDIVESDPVQIHQVLMNICTNAAYAMGEDGGKLKVSLTNVDLGSKFAALHQGIHPGLHVKLSVTDTGQGIAPEILNRIFDPYFTTKEKEGGTGLGLSVAHGIVKKHGGTITAESTEGKGTTFDVYLPVTVKPVPEETGAIETVLTGDEYILFVDDEPNIVNIGKKQLESLGYEVVTAMNGPEALELFKEQPDRFDLVITDMTMPHMTGTRLAKELMKIRPNIPIILCTGYSDFISKEKASAIGLSGFVIKPVDRDVIARTVREVLDRI